MLIFIHLIGWVIFSCFINVVEQVPARAAAAAAVARALAGLPPHQRYSFSSSSEELSSIYGSRPQGQLVEELEDEFYEEVLLSISLLFQFRTDFSCNFLCVEWQKLFTYGGFVAQSGEKPFCLFMFIERWQKILSFGSFQIIACARRPWDGC